MPVVRVARTLHVRLQGRPRNWEADQLQAARQEIVSRALSEFGQRDSIAECRLDGPRLVVAVRNELAVDQFEQITPRLIAAAESDLGPAFDELARSLGNAAWDLAHRDEGASWESVYRDAGFEPRGDARDVFGADASVISAAEVCIDVSGPVAAVARDPQRIEALAWSAVIDRAEQYGGRSSGEFKCRVDLIDAGTLRFRGRSDEVAEAIRAVLGPPVRRPRAGRVIDTWPPSSAPYWGGGSFACAVIAIAVSWSLVAPLAIGAVLLGTALAGAVALRSAQRGGAHIPTTVLGLAPAAIVTGFAVVYAVQMRGPSPGVHVATDPAHMVDAYLLSFGVATTGGFLDLSLHSLAVRWKRLSRCC